MPLMCILVNVDVNVTLNATDKRNVTNVLEINFKVFFSQTDFTSVLVKPLKMTFLLWSSVKDQNAIMKLDSYDFHN